MGKVFDGPALSEVIWEEARAAGACKLLTPRVPFCSSACGSSAACVEDDVCAAYPAARSAGAVTVDGLRLEDGATTFVMSPVVNGYQPAAGVKLASPAFDEGDAIAIAAAGDYFEPFAIEAKGVAPLTLSSDVVSLEAEQPAKLAWTPPASPGLSTIEVKLDISHHGGTKGKIECAAEDSGALEISAELVTDLLALGVAGFPSVVVTRRAVGSTTIAEGRVDLVVSSSVERPVVVAGLTSCTDDTQCSDGQTCQADLTCK
ncbi:MAG: hypothetical protein KIS78_23045 [Labilithrix sp.]|nr:hypothetical protein [Labilithrix sp.]MCW5835296.1 hypothetical protein [Labilithrix sp.]